VVFTTASALCGAATSLGELVAFRILQGVGGGMLTPVGFAMLMRAFPPERRAAASKVLILPTALAPASGPVIGGLLVTHLSWRWVFYVNLPLGVATLVFGTLFLQEHREPRTGRFDLAGFLLSGAGLALILFSLSQGPSKGWGAPVAWVSGVAGLITFAVLVLVELRIDEPMLQLRLLGDRLLRTTMSTMMVAMGTFLGMLFIMPLFLQEVRGMSALESGLTTFPEAVGVMAGSQIAARLYPRLGPRRLMCFGAAGMAASFASFVTIDLDTSLWAIRALMAISGVSMSFALMPLQASAFARIAPSKVGRASAIYNASRQMAAALGVAVLATILSARLPAAGTADLPGEVSAYHTVFLAAAVLSVIGAGVALRVKDSDAAATMRARGVTQAERVLSPES
jgi:EmrB/QacA subfamily drug resistance transporter